MIIVTLDQVYAEPEVKEVPIPSLGPDAGVKIAELNGEDYDTWNNASQAKDPNAWAILVALSIKEPKFEVASLLKLKKSRSSVRNELLYASMVANGLVQPLPSVDEVAAIFQKVERGEVSAAEATATFPALAD